VVMTGAGEFVEVQGTAEQTPFGRAGLDALLALAGTGIRRLVTLQRRALDARGERTFSASLTWGAPKWPPPPPPPPGRPRPALAPPPTPNPPPRPPTPHPGNHRA